MMDGILMTYTHHWNRFWSHLCCVSAQLTQAQLNTLIRRMATWLDVHQFVTGEASWVIHKFIINLVVIIIQPLRIIHRYTFPPIQSYFSKSPSLQLEIINTHFRELWAQHCHSAVFQIAGKVIVMNDFIEIILSPSENISHSQVPLTFLYALNSQ